MARRNYVTSVHLLLLLDVYYGMLLPLLLLSAGHRDRGGHLPQLLWLVLILFILVVVILDVSQSFC